MNAEQLKKNVGQRLRLRPHPLLVQRQLPTLNLVTSYDAIFKTEEVKSDYDWRLDQVTNKDVTLTCDFTGHTVTLGSDNVREFRTPNFLMLKCQLYLEGKKVRVEPL
jgi:hypothetical protein